MGHSVHAALIVFPLVLLAVGVIFDFIRLMGGSSAFTQIAYLLMLSGMIGGAVAALFGWIDWMIILPGSRAKKIGLLHGVVNSVVLLFYAASLYVRSNDPSHPEIAATVFSTVGAGFALIGGILGGELVDMLTIDTRPRTEEQAIAVIARR